jgi:hypothetical protein
MGFYFALFMEHGMNIYKEAIMYFNEYREKVFDPTPSTPGMVYRIAIFWLHPELLPQALVSLNGVQDKVIKVPDFNNNRNNRYVPIIGFSSGVFADNENITDIILPRYIERIPRGAFDGCKNLQRITISKIIRCIPEGAFRNCDSLEDVYFEGSEDDWNNIDIVYKTSRAKNPGQLGLYQEIEDYIIPGNEALLNARIHFDCNLKYEKEPEGACGSYIIKLCIDNITDFFRSN